MARLIAVVLLVMLVVSAGYITLTESTTIHTWLEMLMPQRDIVTINGQGLQDNDIIYQRDNRSALDELRITILASDANSLRFTDLLSMSTVSSDSPTVQVYFEDSGSGFTSGSIFLRQPNGTLEVKKSSIGKDLQKSFKIRLYDRAGLWHEQKVINLNKHYSDALRIRNKLSLDYLTIIPNITSLRTRFTRVFIKDLTSGSLDADFVDYGLFTQIEQPNKLFLTNHGLDPNGHLYEAQDFRFQPLTEDNLNTAVETKGDENPAKLLDMLAAVNDEERDITDIVKAYFDEDNLLTWVATNLLFDNYKTAYTDYMLYSPLNSQVWLFMPYDFSGAWGTQPGSRAPWQQGLSAYWGNTLFRRYFSEPQNIERLKRSIEELTKLVNEKQTKAFLSDYEAILFESISRLPDIGYLPVTIERLRQEFAALPAFTETARLHFYELLQQPMPFALHLPASSGAELTFAWDEAYDLQGEPVTYKLEISKYRDFQKIDKTISSIAGLSYVMPMLPRGTYYWRVLASDASGNVQIATNVYTDEWGDRYFGCRELEVR